MTSRLTTRTHTHNWLTVLCPGLPGWASTKRNVHLLTPILIVRRPLSTSEGESSSITHISTLVTKLPESSATIHITIHNVYNRLLQLFVYVT